ncbi:MAG: response regulator [Planctomycetota bacterium]
MDHTIMVVDDDRDFHDLYTALLEDTEYRLTHVYDGDEALLELEKELPDLILLDMKMNLVDGDTFFLHIKGMPEYVEVPVIIVSAISQKYYKSLKDMDPKLVYIDKA